MISIAADTKKPASDETEVVADTEYFQTLGTAEVGKKKAPVVAAVPKWVQRAVRVSAKVCPCLARSLPCRGSVSSPRIELEHFRALTKQ